MDLVISHVSFATAILALLLAVHLSAVKVATRAPVKFLSLGFACAGLQTLCLSLVAAGVEVALAIHMMPVFALATGPSLALFSISSSTTRWQPSIVHLIQFLPSLAVLVFREWFVFADLINMLILASTLGYGLFMGARSFKGADLFVNLLRYREAARNWQIACAIMFLLSFLGEVLINLEIANGSPLFESWSLLVITLSKTALFMFILLSAMTRSTRFAWVYVFGQSRYGKTPENMDAGEYQLEISGFKRLLAEDKVFLKEDVSLESVAASLGTTPRHLSEAINLNWGENFSKVMNRHRIDEAKNLLTYQPDLNITEIIFRSGFRTKSAFNREFRAMTGLSPTAFRNEKAGN